MRKKEKYVNDELGPFGIIIFGLLLVVGPIYAFLGSLTWVILGAIATCLVLAGINWIFNRNRF